MIDCNRLCWIWWPWSLLCIGPDSIGPSFLYLLKLHTNQWDIPQDVTQKLESTLANWTTEGLAAPLNTDAQHNWNDIRCKATFRQTDTSLHHLAWLHSASQLNNSAELNSMPFPSTATLEDNVYTHIGVTQHIGLCVRERQTELHKCHHGAAVNEFGLHSLFCSWGVDWFPQNTTLNDIVDVVVFSLQLVIVG